MYSYIKGTLEEIGDGEIVIDNHGIGYLILTPASIINFLPSIGENIKIYTYLHVKEDAMTLFGFLTKEDLNLFQLLLTVNGIGPKGALAILAVMTTEDLRFAIFAGDAKAIAKAPGIGAKTAQRVILELKDKLKIEDVLEDASQNKLNSITTVAGGSSTKKNAIEALVALGYSSTEAAKAVSQISITEDMTVEDILDEAFKKLSFF